MLGVRALLSLTLLSSGCSLLFEPTAANSDDGNDGSDGSSASGGFSFTPSNVDLDVTGEEADLVFSDSYAYVINTTTRTVMHADTKEEFEAGILSATELVVPLSPLQGQRLEGGVPVVVVQARSITIDPGVYVYAVGASPLILAASEDIVIDGALLAKSRRGQPFQGAGGQLALIEPTVACESFVGGHGGSHATSGAASVSTACGFAESYKLPKGVAAPNLEPLTGGGAGLPGLGLSTCGGAGGGALQLTAGNSVTVSTMGSIDVGGAGGCGGLAPEGGDRGGGGGGGGAGGGLLIEAPEVVLEAFLGAQGGGGGEGGDLCSMMPCPGADGQDGSILLMSAAGGNATAGGSGAGGNGSHPMTGVPTEGDSGESGLDYAYGGGGGGAGRIYIRTGVAFMPALGQWLLPGDPSEVAELPL